MLQLSKYLSCSCMSIVLISCMTVLFLLNGCMRNNGNNFAVMPQSTERGNDCEEQTTEKDKDTVTYIDGMPVSGSRVPELNEFDDQMVKFMQKYQIRAGILAVMKDGKIVLNHGYGWNNKEENEIIKPDTLMRIASVTKPVTAAAIKKLIKEGKLSLDTRILTVLDIKPFKGKLGDPRWEDITVEHLLEHRGGWDSNRDLDPMLSPIAIADEMQIKSPPEPADIISYMMGRQLQFIPGGKQVYSNFGYCVLGRIVEKLSGMKYIDYIQKSVLGPVGITGVKLGHSLPEGRDDNEIKWYDSSVKAYSAFEPSRLVLKQYGGYYIEGMDSNGGLIATSADLVRFAQSYLVNGDERRNYVYSSSHAGDMRGSHAWLIWRSDNINIAVIFNKDEAAFASNGAARSMLNDTADRISSGQGTVLRPECLLQ